MSEGTQEHQIEQNYRKLAQRLVYETIWEAYNLALMHSGDYERANHLHYRLGLHRDRRQPSETWLAHRQAELDEWVGSDEFHVIVTKLGFDAGWLKENIRDIAKGKPTTPEWRKLLKESCSHYARPRGNRGHDAGDKPKCIRRRRAKEAKKAAKEGRQTRLSGARHTRKRTRRQGDV